MVHVKRSRWISMLVGCAMTLGAMGSWQAVEAQQTIMWTLNQGTFVDGGTATGSFIWDPDLDQPLCWTFDVAGGNVTRLPPITLSDTLPNHVALAFDFVIEGVVIFRDSPTQPRRDLRLGIIPPVLAVPTSFLPLLVNGRFTGNGLMDCFDCTPFRTNPLSSGFLSGVRVPVPVESVMIDIKPGSDKNTINFSSRSVRVAILTTDTFDAATVNPASVTLAGPSLLMRGKAGRSGSMRDVDHDGDLDLIVRVFTEERVRASVVRPPKGFAPRVVEATVVAGTTGCAKIQGTGTIRIVPDDDDDSRDDDDVDD